MKSPISRHYYKLLLCLVFVGLTVDLAIGQVSITMSGTPVSVTFDGFQGEGLSPTPIAGELDSDNWAITGLSDGDITFGAVATSGDYAEGLTDGTGETGGGLYGFDDGLNQMIWVQPTGGDYTPGSMTLRLQNNTGGLIDELDVSYVIWVLNDQGRSNTWNFSYSEDDLTYAGLPALDYVSPEAASSLLFAVPRATTITGLNISDGGFIYLRWSSDDFGGSFSRDEFGLDDIVVTAPGASVCSSAMAPLNPTSSVGAGGVTLGWDILPLSVACQVNGGPEGGGSANLNLIASEPSSAFIPDGALTPGTNYVWKVRCACSISPVDASAFSVEDTFTTLAPRLESFDLKISPSPATDVIQLSGAFVTDPFAVKLYDLTGAMVLSGQNEQLMKVSYLQEGYYFLVVENEEGQVSRSVVLQR